MIQTLNQFKVYVIWTCVSKQNHTYKIFQKYSFCQWFYLLQYLQRKLTIQEVCALSETQNEL